ncbi:TPA: hypothetical protein UMV35_000914 [Stenotrophomonas maltophilia]|uniref:hypothetical protein n=1 Tax=Stenotrophomonas sp. GD03680 TaxID=2975365 RepID=UPI0018D3C712|nr:hypothetical protein [Stenotrophomonas sp. GD03680]MBH1591937.1 hypothetical protein [Stenotrophomonas maltophilia]MDH2022531.1 hypothetical protein [Stenotrophomonas sp. GD03680]HEL3748654.1 hypothetical protein [Stenotrophomonas maltophilia]HEL7729596.1 hypothetical protein [Stenotrophomonas maltophilia]
MSTNVRQIREFQAVRDAIASTGLSPAPLFRRLNAEQRLGNRGLSVVDNALRLRRQFRDEFTNQPGPEAA